MAAILLEMRLLGLNLKMYAARQRFVYTNLNVRKQKEEEREAS